MLPIKYWGMNKRNSSMILMVLYEAILAFDLVDLVLM